MDNVTNTNVELEADGTPIFAALDSAKNRISVIQKLIKSIVEDATLGTTKFDQKIAQQVSNLQAALGQMKSLAKFAEDGGYGKGAVKNTNAEQAMARATLKAAEFKKTIDQASNAIEAMNARINKVDQKLAKFGNTGVTSGPAFEKLEAQRKSLTTQLELYKSIGAQQEALDRKVGRTKGIKPDDFELERNKLKAAKDALEAKMMNPKSRSVVNENAEALKALNAYEVALDGARQKRANLLELSRQEAKAERDRVKNMSDYDRALKQSEDQKRAQMEEMWGAQKRRETEERRLLKEKLDLEEKTYKEIEQFENERATKEAARIRQAELAAERLRKIDVQYQRGQIPSQTAAAVAGGTGDALKIDLMRRVLRAKEEHVLADEKDKQVTLDTLKLEQARLAAITKQLKTKERDEAAAGTPHAGILPAGGFGTVLARTGAYAAAGSAIFAVVGALQQGFSFAMEFEDSLHKLQAVAGATDKQMVGLTESIIDVGRQSRFSLGDLAEAATTLAQAGFSVADIKSSLNAVQDLAAASGSTLAQSVDLVTSAISAFSLSSTDANRIADGMVSALNQSKLTVGDVASAIQTVGSTAAASNISLQEMTGTIGAMTQAGVRGQMASTGLRQFLVDLQNPSKQLSEQLTKLGLTFEDVDVSTRGLPAVLKTLSSAGFGASEAFAGLENRSAAAYLTMRRQIPLMEQLIASQNDFGSAAAAAAKATNDFTAQWQMFKNNLGSGAFSIVEALGLDSLVRKLNESIEKLKWIDEYNKTHPNDRTSMTASAYAEKVNTGWEGYTNAKHALDEYNLALDAANTKAKDASDKFATQNQSLLALETALNRLTARQGELKNGSTALATETASLSTQFPGLAKYLDSATNSVENLKNAMSSLRTEMNLAAAADAIEVSKTQAEKRSVAKQGAEKTYSDILAHFKNIPKEIADAMLGAMHGNANDRLKLLGENGAASPALQAAMKQLGQELVTMANAGATQRSADIAARANLILTEQGAVARNTEIASLTNSEADKPKREAMLKQIDADIQRAAGDLARIQALQAQRGAVEAKMSAPGQLHQTNTASQVASEERAATTSSYMKKFLEEALPGVRVTSTKDDHSKYVAGTKRVSDHYLDRAIDFVPAGGVNSMTKDQVRDMLEGFGIKIRRNAQGVEQLFGPGDKGHKDHWHFAWEGSSAPSVDKLRENDQDNSQLAVNNADKDLKEKLRQRGLAVTTETFDNQNKSALAALDKWEEAYRKLNDDQMRNFTPAQKALRLQEVEDTIKTKREEFQTKTVDSLIELLNKSFKAIEAVFAAQMKPFELEVAKIQGQLDGLNRPSMQGHVPEYVKNLAQQRLDKANEAKDRARYAQLPDLIQANQTKLSQTTILANQSGNDPAELEKYNAQVNDLSKALAGLEAERAHLEQVFGAQGLIPRSFGEGFHQAIEAIKGASDFGLSFSQQMTQGIGGALEEVRSGFATFFTDVLNGSSTVLGAFGNFAKSIIRYLEEMAAKALASQLFNFLIGLIPGVGPSVSSGTSSGPLSVIDQLSGTGHYAGGLIGRASGGPVTQGTSARDSVITKLSKGEYVVQKSAVDSVGTSFMENLNRRGARALHGMSSTPALVMPAPAHQEMKVFVVAPDSRPSMSPSDVLLVIQDDMLKGGTTKQLVKHISQGG